MFSLFLFFTNIFSTFYLQIAKSFSFASLKSSLTTAHKIKHYPRIPCVFIHHRIAQDFKCFMWTDYQRFITLKRLISSSLSYTARSSRRESNIFYHFFPQFACYQKAKISVNSFLLTRHFILNFYPFFFFCLNVW